jgi:DUF2075 family protein
MRAPGLTAYTCWRRAAQLQVLAGELGKPTPIRVETIEKTSKKNPATYLDLAKNTYRVLLTRGLQGCFVYFQDERTRDFFLSRVEWPEE